MHNAWGAVQRQRRDNASLLLIYATSTKIGGDACCDMRYAICDGSRNVENRNGNISDFSEKFQVSSL